MIPVKLKPNLPTMADIQFTISDEPLRALPAQREGLGFGDDGDGRAGCLDSKSEEDHRPVLQATV